MSVIKLASMGGLMPSVLPRALPDGAAQKAANLLARTSEFRPLLNDLSVATSSVTNPKTLYRLARDANGAFTSDMTANWKTSATELNYVKGQIKDDSKERTYYTYADGSQPPRVLDTSGYDKPLGVPAPATAPTGVINTVYSYSPEARAAELAAAREAAVDAIRKSVTLTWLGAKFGGLTHPGNTTPGYMDLYDPNIYNPDHAKVFRVFAVAGPNSQVITNSYTSSVLTAQANPQPVVAGITPYLGAFDPRLGGVYTQASGPYGSTSWATYGQHVFAVPFYVYGRTYDFDINTVKALFAAIKMPGTNGTKQLFTDAQATAFLTTLKAIGSTTSRRIKPLLDAIDADANVFHSVLDSGNLSSIGYIVDKQAELKVRSEAIGAEYDKILSELPAMLEQFFYTQNIDSEVPQGTPRIIEDRFYIVTYVTAWGEESAPSPVSQLVELDENDTVTGSPPNPPAGYGITKFRYYRSNSGATSAAFQFVGEADFSPASLAGTALTTITDTLKPTELGEVCPSLSWLMPPSNLQGLVGMPNGINIGFFGNTVCPCENYVQYAFPVEYQMPTEYPVVGIGVFGQTAVVLTQGTPYYSSGTDAASMSLVKVDSPHACVSRRSIASSDGGVMYASATGVCLASAGGIQVVTVQHFTHEDWKKLNPASIIGAIHESTYFFLYTPASGVQACYALHMETGKLTTVDVQGSAFHVDLLTDQLYVVAGNTIKALFAGSTYRTGVWRSKVIVLAKQSAFAWLTVESDYAAPITVRWYGDGVLRHTAVLTSRDPVRLPCGKFLEHEIEIESTERWNALTMASSTAELQGI